MPESADEEQRRLNRERVARGKPKGNRGGKNDAAPISRDPRIADSKRDRWKSARRAVTAAKENREVKRFQ